MIGILIPVSIITQHFTVIPVTFKLWKCGHVQGTEWTLQTFFTGSRKPKQHVPVDVESILANIIAIRLQHLSLLRIIGKKKQLVHEQFPRKRCNSCDSECDIPQKKRCTRS